ncbi:MAG: S49 family peptidase [Odoribacteraceae bacterium]|nr:S49 family peptidase [Odoribacteraceae bacterium]
MAIRENYRKVLEIAANKMVSEPDFKLDPDNQCVSTSAGAVLPNDHERKNPFDAFDKGSVVIIPLEGVMTRNQSWYYYGVDMIANFLRLANESDAVSGVILRADTPGGTVNSVFILQDAISKFTKPIVTLTDGNLCSAGIWAASFTDAIFALNEMNVVGSIGTMVTLSDFTGMYKQWGIVSRSIYPPESKFKNLPYREASKEDPDDSLIIREILSPLAVNFQETIKKNRPRLDTSVEGIIEGREFYAGDAVKHGLIDGIASLEMVVEHVNKEIKRRENIISNI